MMWKDWRENRVPGTKHFARTQSPFGRADMSGEGSSSGAGGKRRRGPVPRPRGVAREQRQPVPVLRRRRIRYEGQERVNYARIPLRREHPLLQFEVNTKEWTKLQKIIRTEILEHWTIDWDWLASVGARDRVERLLGPRLRAMHKEGSFAEDDAVSFSLGRMVHEMSIPQFAVASGFYTEEEVVTPEFVTGLRGVYVNQRELCLGSDELARFWGTIADVGFAKTNLITSVRDPIYRYVLKVFSTTLVGRKSGKNKANWIDIFLLMCLVEERNMNLASVLAWSLNRARRGGNRAALDMGPYITKLADNLGVFQKYSLATLRVGAPSRHFQIRDLQLAGILTLGEPIIWLDARQGPQVMPPVGHSADDVMQGMYPPARQRPPQRREIPAPQYPRRQPPPDPLTLSSLYDRMDQGFGRIDYRHDRQDGALRYMMSRMSIDVPDFFQPFVDPVQFPMPGYYDPSGAGGSSQQGGSGSGQYGYVDPTPEFQVYGQGDDEESEDEEED
ncbi:hypothetical protein L1987_49374 [Smallanthus sonchifolius]|uniref:Uncharacterized protein n=1 Tax=Smallanthus sonchifolius TaxID=185202 RepID=A0ACB9FUC2_9ASTR|nr:hypothetical protein L1987_49374 [Smallanthus sonchifolius]